ncbi:hypothetical protein [Erwinia tasmaniensis]|uniref:hypothetical protein n=1 Tax=Erwinia tasmaniensis TaxID=338565 RepID=UPI00030D6073|nr:hypothetical protein [Erwinia tasmaniensis]
MEKSILFHNVAKNKHSQGMAIGVCAKLAKSCLILQEFVVYVRKALQIAEETLYVKRPGVARP